MLAEDYLTLRFVQLYPVEAARQIEQLESSVAAGMIASLPAPDTANVLDWCQPSVAARILEHVSLEHVAGVMSELRTSTASVVFRQLSPELQMRVVDKLDPLYGPRFRRILLESKQTAGSLADPYVVTLPPDVTVEQGIEMLKRNLRRVLYYVYVVDRDAKLEGVVTLKQLLMVDPEAGIASVMNDQVVSISASLTKEEFVAHPHWSRFPTLPVVDHDGIFLGVLRYRILQQVIEERVNRTPPSFLPAVLLDLWQAYSLACIRVLTELSQTVQPSPPSRTYDEGDKPLGS